MSRPHQARYPKVALFSVVAMSLHSDVNYWLRRDESRVSGNSSSKSTVEARLLKWHHA